MDSDLNLLITIMDDLKSSFLDTSMWENSPFEWLRCLPSRKVGAFAEELLSRWLAQKGFYVKRPSDSEADRILQLPQYKIEKRVEIKFSTLWSGGSYRFQQIRDQNYDILLCFGVSPQAAHLWAIPKHIIMSLWKKGIISSQHGGRRGRDTAWIDINPKNPPDWILAYGGSLAEGLRSLENLLNLS